LCLHHNISRFNSLAVCKGDLVTQTYSLLKDVSSLSVDISHKLYWQKFCFLKIGSCKVWDGTMWTTFHPRTSSRANKYWTVLEI